VYQSVRFARNIDFSLAAPRVEEEAMALQNLPGAKQVFIGPNVLNRFNILSTGATTLDATNEALIWIGRVETSDGASHTIDTTGSSSIQWRSAGVTFTDVGSLFSVGIAPVDTATGPPARASNTTDVIDFDVAAVFVGNGGGITANAWQTSVPTTGTKTIAHGDLVAICFQFTTRAGTDSVIVNSMSPGNNQHHLPMVTGFLAASYGVQTLIPSAVISFSDGVLGWVHFGDVATSRSTRIWDNNDAAVEYGQLYNLPFATKIYGIYGAVDADNNLEVVLYSDPLGTPVPEKTIEMDSNVTISADGRFFVNLFSSPFTYTKNTDIAVTYKPTTTSTIGVGYKTLANAAHRITDPWGTSGYGISRATGGGAFADTNSSLDHYFIGLIVGAFEG
jgi:hypothetical protein